MAEPAAAGRKTRVGPYEVGKTIGEGSFAKVKHARDSRTGAVRAIKVLDRNHVLRHKMVEQVHPSLLALLSPFPLRFAPAGITLTSGEFLKNPGAATGRSLRNL
jgi:serine/threonine protein kinase